MIGSRALAVTGALVLPLACLAGGCGEDVELLPSGKASLTGYSHSEECLASGDPVGVQLGSAEVEVEVNGLEISVKHKNAFLNCCLDSILVDFYQRENLLKLVEHEAVTMPCDCICPFEVVATIEVSKPGMYILEVWTEAEMVWAGGVEVD